MSRTVTFQPSEELSSFIEGQVKSGRYQNQSEVVRTGLRLLQEQEAKSKLRQLLDIGALMLTWKVFGEYSRTNWCITGNLRRDNKHFRRLPNTSKFSITDSVNKRD
ncbi:putative addiction module antidote protein, CC2985 family [Nitrosomonas aestuarii]|uniref:Putative addiction module antidote protein, CC2985 family n=1 Tax=Nitrosomonas aestuarii TaxID=52441 RepID=A0A1I4GUL7_9PROT|nr:putative addiction module antidote protein, CC2985 family [Nitrosomonas aestuarii]